jgi:hypothetical protein
MRWTALKDLFRTEGLIYLFTKNKIKNKFFIDFSW